MAVRLPFRTLRAALAPLACARLALLAVLALLLAAPAQASPGAERRVALVIGNGAYPTAPLKNPVNDARDMAAALRSLGFEVIERQNASLAQMEGAVSEFWGRLKKGGAGLFYFAGHGLQVAGRNYLVPVDARLEAEQDARYKCMDAGLVLGRMEDAGNGLNIVILDACRNNPFARSWRSASEGLAKMDAPRGSLIAYATAPDSVAADGAGKNGLYTEKLLAAMRAPGQPVEQMFKRVRDEVMRATGDRQVPWESTSLRGDFYFSPGAGATAVQPQAQQPAPAQIGPDKPAQAMASRLAGAYRWVVNDGAQEYGQFVFTPSGNTVSGHAVGFMLASASTRTPLENLRLEGSQLSFQVKHSGPFQFTPHVYSFRCDLSAGMDVIPVVGLDTPQLKRPIASSRLVRLADAPVPPPPAAPQLALAPAPKQAPPAPAGGHMAGDTWTEPLTGMEFVWVPGGTYEMGCGPWAGECAEDELPVHTVRVDGFWMGKHEVTQKQWKKIMGANPSEKSEAKVGDAFPVDQIGWKDAKAFVARMNRLNAGTFRLPTEAEWEYAARSGGKQEKYAGGDDLGRVAWHRGNSGTLFFMTSNPVGTKAPNGLGLYDMSGSVGEWCEDVYDRNAYAFHAPDRPLVTGEGVGHVYRGGSWYRYAKQARTVSRDGFDPKMNALVAIGLRLVREP